MALSCTLQMFLVDLYVQILDLANARDDEHELTLGNNREPKSRHHSHQECTPHFCDPPEQHKASS